MAKIKKKRRIKRKDFSTLFLNEMVNASAQPSTSTPGVSGSLKITFERCCGAVISPGKPHKDVPGKEVIVDSCLLRVGYKHGKALMSQVRDREIPLGKKKVPFVNGPCTASASTSTDVLPTITLPCDMLVHQENDYCSGALVSCKLVFRVSQGSNTEEKPNTATPVQIIGQQPGINYDELEWDSSSSSSNGDSSDELLTETFRQSLIAELPMFDSSHKCLMPSGRYEVALRLDNPTSTCGQENSLQLTWENPASTTVNLGMQLHSNPVLALSVHWEDGDPLYLLSPSVIPVGKWEMPKWAMDHYPKKYGWTAKRGKQAHKLEFQIPQQLTFYYMYGTNDQQQIETRTNLNCPFCNVKCPMLYSLLKHLQLCHPRFHFTYSLNCKVHQIEVKLNKNYISTRDTNDKVMVFRPERGKPSMAEFMAPSDIVATKSSSVFARADDRICYHSATSMPIHVNELDEDSEEELDPEWMRLKMQMMIDEFTDVNDGEKALMKLWNSHVMKINPYADQHIPRICKDFVSKYAQVIKEKNLVGNLTLHLANISDFHLITPQNVLECMQIVHGVQFQ